MKTLRLFVPGSFEDAQVYMGHLIAFTTDRDTRLIELEPLTNRLETAYPEWKGILTLAFARNDWLTGAVVTSLARNERFATALNEALDELSNAELEITEDDVAFHRLADFTQEADLILDSVFYGGRMYLGTTAGLFDYVVDWDAKLVDRSRRRIDARCVAATAEYGAVNASCEDDGLFTAYDEFGWRAARGNASELFKTADRSLRTAFYGTDLINYEAAVQPELLRASVEQVDPDVAGGEWGRERKVVTRFEEPSDEIDTFVTGLQTERGVPTDDLQFIWNSSRAFFINTYTHGFFTAVRTTTTDSGMKFTRHGATSGRVVAVHPFSRGWVIETDFRAYVLSGGKLTELLDTEPLSVRTFEGSKRYRRLVAVTVEEGVHLISAIGPVGPRAAARRS